jgi:TPP-dependent pyruvate/acetoin dehydrogenase alpha subunit
MACAEGPSRGRDKGLYFGDLERGIIPTISALGDNCPVACGVGIALKFERKQNVVIVYFGDGAASRGDVHEAMNLAAVMRLPTIFLVNNNGFAFSTPTRKQFAVESLAVRGEAYGMPGITLDGNDVLAVYEAVGKAIRSARSGAGPTLIECKTFRMTGHAGHDSADYVPQSFLEEGRRKDPIAVLEQYLINRKLMTPVEVGELSKGVLKQIDEALAEAESDSLPEGGSCLAGVYCDDHCWWERPISHDVTRPTSRAKKADA